MTQRAHNLPEPETLWTFAAAEAAVAAGMGSFWPQGRRIAEDGSLVIEDGGGNWFRLVRVEGDRLLLVGWDRAGDTTNPLKAPTHLFADAPAWLPWEWIERTEERGPLGFAYWWDGKTWTRSAYPAGVDDDGVVHHTEPRRDAASATALLADLLEGHLAEIPEWVDAPQQEWDVFRARIGELTAAAGERAATKADFGFLADIPFDTTAAMAVLKRAGVAAGSSLAVDPVSAGAAVPAERQRVRQLSDQEWARRWRWRCARRPSGTGPHRRTASRCSRSPTSCALWPRSTVAQSR
jgi:hypothetical protein